MKPIEPSSNEFKRTESLSEPLRLPDCEDPKNCECSRDCNLFRPPPDYVRPVAADASPRERLEASTFFDLLAEVPAGQEHLYLPVPEPDVRIGIDPPMETRHRRREPTLDEMAALTDLDARARAIDANPQCHTCPAWRLLVESVKGVWLLGAIVQGYVHAPPEPQPQPKRRRKRKPPSDKMPRWLERLQQMSEEEKWARYTGLFGAFGLEFPEPMPESPPPRDWQWYHDPNVRVRREELRSWISRYGEPAAREGARNWIFMLGTPAEREELRHWIAKYEASPDKDAED